jgi:hypothetical protein
MQHFDGRVLGVFGGSATKFIAKIAKVAQTEAVASDMLKFFSCCFVKHAPQAPVDSPRTINIHSSPQKMTFSRQQLI